MRFLSVSLFLRGGSGTGCGALSGAALQCFGAHVLQARPAPGEGGLGRLDGNVVDAGEFRSGNPLARASMTSCSRPAGVAPGPAAIDRSPRRRRPPRWCRGSRGTPRAAAVCCVFPCRGRNRCRGEAPRTSERHRVDSCPTRRGGCAGHRFLNAVLGVLKTGQSSPNQPHEAVLMLEDVFQEHSAGDWQVECRTIVLLQPLSLGLSRENRGRLSIRSAMWFSYPRHWSGKPEFVPPAVGRNDSSRSFPGGRTPGPVAVPVEPHVPYGLVHLGAAGAQLGGVRLEGSLPTSRAPPVK